MNQATTLHVVTYKILQIIIMDEFFLLEEVNMRRIQRHQQTSMDWMDLPYTGNFCSIQGSLRKVFLDSLSILMASSKVRATEVAPSPL